MWPLAIALDVLLCVPLVTWLDVLVHLAVHQGKFPRRGGVKRVKEVLELLAQVVPLLAGVCCLQQAPEGPRLDVLAHLAGPRPSG